MVRELGGGGSERQLTEIARSLDPDEFEVHVACFRPEGLRLRQLEASGVKILALPVRSLYRRSAWVGAWTLIRYLRQYRIHLVHTFDAPATIFGVPAARMAGIPVVLSSQRAHRQLSTLASRWMLRLTDRLAHGVVVNCQALARHLVEDEHVAQDKVLLCRNGIDTTVFNPAGRRRMTSVADAGLVAGCVCMLRSEKRLDLLVEAFRRIAAPGRRLVMVGSGAMIEPLERQCEALGLGRYCHFEPATDDVASWLRSLDIFVLPSRTEGLSNSLMEAMACGCAVVASDAGGNPELVSHLETGLLFASGDAQALGDALVRLAADPALRAGLGSRAAARMARDFTLEMASGRMAAIYRDRLRRVSPPVR